MGRFHTLGEPPRVLLGGSVLEVSREGSRDVQGWGRNNQAYCIRFRRSPHFALHHCRHLTFKALQGRKSGIEKKSHRDGLLPSSCSPYPPNSGTPDEKDFGDASMDLTLCLCTETDGRSTSWQVRSHSVSSGSYCFCVNKWEGIAWAGSQHPGTIQTPQHMQSTQQGG